MCVANTDKLQLLLFFYRIYASNTVMYYVLLLSGAYVFCFRMNLINCIYLKINMEIWTEQSLVYQCCGYSYTWWMLPLPCTMYSCIGLSFCSCSMFLSTTISACNVHTDDFLCMNFHVSPEYARNGQKLHLPSFSCSCVYVCIGAFAYVYHKINQHISR